MSWFVGDPWKQTIAVTDPETDTPLSPEPEMVKVVVVAPGGEEATAEAELVGDVVYGSIVTLTRDGKWQAFAYAITNGVVQGIGKTEIRVEAAPTPV